MTIRRTISALAIVAASLTFAPQTAAQIPAGVAEGWSGEFEHAARQLTQLAEAIPADKYKWAPGAGVRSISEVLMHIALGNHLLLGQAGVKPAVDLTKIKDSEKSITAKAEVIKFLQASFDAVRTGTKTIDRSRPAKFFGKESTVDGVLLRLLVHNHEHMGQLIAYARMNGVTPPWSAKGGGD